MFQQRNQLFNALAEDAINRLVDMGYPIYHGLFGKRLNDGGSKRAGKPRLLARRKLFVAVDFEPWSIL